MHHTARRRPAFTHLLILLSAALFATVMVVQALGLLQFIPVISGSMSGFVEAGDVSIVVPLDAEDLREGDVLAFYPPIEDARLTLHRVVEVVQPGPTPVVRTKGDANQAVDPWTAQLQGPQLWRAAGRIPWIGHIVLWLHGPLVRLVALGIVLAGILLIGFQRLWTPPPARGPEDHRSPEPASGVRRRHTPGRSVGALALVASLGAVGLAGTLKPGAASFRGAAGAEQTVNTVSVVPPVDLRAELLCELGVARAVRLTWTPSASTGIIDQEIWRRPPDAAPVLVATVAPDAATHDDDLIDTLLDLNTTYAVRAVAEGWASPFSNDAALLNLCDAPDPNATALPTEAPTAEPTSEPTAEPTSEATPEPATEPTAGPTAQPIPQPTAEPAPEPASGPTLASPTAEPSPVLTEVPEATAPAAITPTGMTGAESID